jgi:anti-sigma regulatory factor (Ser/Thr protein kinase)
MTFSLTSLRAARRLVAHEAQQTSMSVEQREDLVLAVDELTTNSVVHGGGQGTLLIWRRDEGILCEIRDQGHISDPLAGQRPPTPEQATGRGLWVVRHLCDRVQISSSLGRTIVRVEMSARR